MALLTVYAVNGISFDAKIFGLVDQLQQSTLARMIMGIILLYRRKARFTCFLISRKALLQTSTEKISTQYTGYLPGLRGSPESHEGCRHRALVINVVFILR